MSDEFKSKFPHLSPGQAAKTEAAINKHLASLKVKHLTKDKDWSILQDILQEVIATKTIQNPEVKVVLTEAYKEVPKIVEERFKDDPETKQILLEGLPSIQSIRDWVKKEGWEEAVWKKIHGENLFNKERRAAMINALYERGVQKDTVAAKIWLQLSGDLVEKSEVTNKDSTVERFREINSILHKNKKES